MTKSLKQNAVIGILGGGQLGRMLSVAAARLGFRVAVFEPGGDCPASHVANFHLKAQYDDVEALKRFADSVDVITYEFENVPAAALDHLGAICPIHPGRRALAVSQDRLDEKSFLRDLGLNTAPFAAVSSADELRTALTTIGAPAILKTRRMGYDGKGQVRITDPDQVDKAWDQMRDADAILEGFVNFTCEISVIGARAQDGQVTCFDPGENLHTDGILRRTTIPAQLNTSQRTDAVLLTGKILNALDYVGILGVELFVTPAGLIVNEIAPRVHNSGHWTQNGCQIDQFEQHIRAIAGLPLGDGARHVDVVMENLIGDDMDKLDQLAADPGVALHLYGKSDVKPGRKMGHFNRVTPKS